MRQVKVYGNFSINMKTMLNKILCNFIPDFVTLYKFEAVQDTKQNRYIKRRCLFCYAVERYF